MPDKPGGVQEERTRGTVRTLEIVQGLSFPGMSMRLPMDRCRAVEGPSPFRYYTMIGMEALFQGLFGREAGSGVLQAHTKGLVLGCRERKCPEALSMPPGLAEKEFRSPPLP